MSSPIKRVRVRLATAYLKRVKRKTSALSATHAARIKELDRKLSSYGGEIGSILLGNDLGLSSAGLPSRHRKEVAERNYLQRKSLDILIKREKARARARAVAGKPRRKYYE